MTRDKRFAVFLALPVVLCVSVGLVHAGEWWSKYGMDRGWKPVDPDPKVKRFVEAQPVGDPATQIDFVIRETESRRTSPIASLHFSETSLPDALSMFTVGMHRKDDRATLHDYVSAGAPGAWDWERMSPEAASEYEPLVLIPDPAKYDLFWATPTTGEFRPCDSSWAQFTQDAFVIPTDEGTRRSAFFQAADWLAADPTAAVLIHEADSRTPRKISQTLIIPRIGERVVPILMQIESEHAAAVEVPLLEQIEDRCVQRYMERLRKGGSPDGIAIWRRILRMMVDAPYEVRTAASRVVVPAPITDGSSPLSFSTNQEKNGLCVSDSSNVSVFVAQSGYKVPPYDRSLLVTASSSRPTWYPDLSFLPAIPSPELALASLAAGSRADAHLIVSPKGNRAAIFAWKEATWALAGPTVREKRLWDATTTMDLTGKTVASVLADPLAREDEAVIGAITDLTSSQREMKFCDYVGPVAGDSGDRTALVMGSAEGNGRKLRVWRSSGGSRIAPFDAELRFVTPKGGLELRPSTYNTWKPHFDSLFRESAGEGSSIYAGDRFFAVASGGDEASSVIQLFQHVGGYDGTFRPRTLPFRNVLARTKDNTVFRVDKRRSPTRDETLRGMLARPEGWRALGWLVNPLGQFDL